MNTTDAKPTNTSDTDFEGAVHTAREDILQRILDAGMLLFGVLAVIFGFQQTSWGIGVTYALIAFLFYKLRDENLAYRVRVAGLLGSLYFIGAGLLVLFGLLSVGGFYLLTLPVFAMLLLGELAGYIAGGLSIFTLVVGAALASRGTLLSVPSGFQEWLLAGVNFILALVILVQSQKQLIEAQEYVITVSKQKRELQETRAELTQRTRQLDYERYLLHTLLDTVSDRIFFKDRNGRYLRISNALAERTGVSPQAMLGKTDFDFFSAEYAVQVQTLERRWRAACQCLTK